MRMPRKHNESYLQDAWEAISHGDENAIAELYGHYAPMLRAVGYRYIQNEEIVKDLVQDVFIKTLQGIDIKENVKGYLITAVKNQCLSHIQTHKRRQEIVENEIPTAPTSSHTNLEMDSQMILERIQHLANPTQRKVMLMSINGFSEEEIAKAINEPIDRIRKIRYQAKKNLEKDPLIQELK